MNSQFYKKYYGKKFSQASLDSNLQRIACGQHIIFKFFLLLFTISLFCLAGSLIGVMSAYVGRSLVFFFQGDNKFLFIIYTIVVLSIWLIETSRVSLTSGLWKAIVSALIIFIASFVRFKKLDYLFLFFTISFLAISFFSFLTISLSFSLVFVLLNERHKYIKILMAILIIFLSVIVAHFVAKSSEERVLSFNDFTVIKIFTGIIFSLAIVKASSEVTSFNNKPKPSFLFLKSWAIALSTWGSTCFYNLDLSGVDFTEAIVANTDFRGNKFYRTCLINVKGLDRARVDNRYLDLDNPKVQKLLTEGWCDDCNFSWLNLQGAYLRNAVLRDFNFTETNLNGANLSAADLRDAILVHAQCIDVDFTGANLTGICIQDWSVNSQTRFDNVKCDYIYRKIDDRGKPCDRYPLDRNFEPREFESLYQEVGNVVELVFKEGMNWRAFAFTLQKLQIEDDGLGLQLKGIEKRGDMWVVKVTHNENVPTQEVEKRLNGSYTQLQQLLAAKEQQINRLLGIVENQTEAIKEISKRFGNNFWITGSTITNLSGSGQIEYHEAADQLRKIVANSSDQVQLKATVQNLLAQLQGQNVATTAGTQAELIKQVLLTEAEKDPVFKQLLVLQGQQFADVIPEEAIATAIREAIASLG